MDNLQEGSNTFMHLYNLKATESWDSDTYCTFIEYCEATFSYKANYVQKLLRAAKVYKVLEPHFTTENLPQSESTIRKLTNPKFKDTDIIATWQLILDTKAVKANDIAAIVYKYKHTNGFRVSIADSRKYRNSKFKAVDATRATQIVMNKREAAAQNVLAQYPSTQELVRELKMLEYKVREQELEIMELKAKL